MYLKIKEKILRRKYNIMMLEENNQSLSAISDADRAKLYDVIVKEYSNICGIVIVKQRLLKIC